MIYKQLAEIQRTLKAPKNQYNSFGKYNYRSCEDILEAVKPLLNGLALLLSDEIVVVGDRYYVKATATLTDGTNSISNPAYAREENEKKGMDSSQLTGATSSYARKYALAGLFLLDDCKDADTMDNTDKKEPSKKSKLETPVLRKAYVMVQEVRKQTGTSKKSGKEWIKYIIKDTDGVEYHTFSETHAKFAKDSIGTNIYVHIEYLTSEYGNNLETISLPENDLDM